MILSCTPEVKATLLAAVRHYQRSMENGLLADPWIRDIATNCGSLPRMKSADLDQLCESINGQPAVEIPKFATSLKKGSNGETLNDQYPEEVIANPSLYDAVEVHGVREHIDTEDPDNSYCEVDEENPEFFSVYAHMVTGGIICIGDFAYPVDAQAFAAYIAGKLGYPTYNCVKDGFKGLFSPTQAERVLDLIDQFLEGWQNDVKQGGSSEEAGNFAKVSKECALIRPQLAQVGLLP